MSQTDSRKVIYKWLVNSRALFTNNGASFNSFQGTLPWINQVEFFCYFLSFKNRRYANIICKKDYRGNLQTLVDIPDYFFKSTNHNETLMTWTPIIRLCFVKHILFLMPSNISTIQIQSLIKISLLYFQHKFC